MRKKGFALVALIMMFGALVTVQSCDERETAAEESELYGSHDDEPIRPDDGN